MVKRMIVKKPKSDKIYELTQIESKEKYTYTNQQYSHDENDTKIDLSKQPELPKGYMPHVEVSMVTSNGSLTNGSTTNGGMSNGKQSFHQLEKPSQRKEQGERKKPESTTWLG